MIAGVPFDSEVRIKSGPHTHANFGIETPANQPSTRRFFLPTNQIDRGCGDRCEFFARYADTRAYRDRVHGGGCDLGQRLRTGFRWDLAPLDRLDDPPADKDIGAADTGGEEVA